ncbi:MAG: oxidoreductase [Actinobacteria bacterium RBG_16_64_13]|nr:MAG: oxidoreductase [Actinobacteria bacterium RBG_16_64_13]
MGDRLRGKVAVVTGSGGMGIGQGCALAMAREGAHVVGCNRRKEAGAETEALIKSEGLSYETFLADLTDPAQNDRLMAFAVDKFGGLDILVNSAAFVEFAPIAEMDYEKHWRRTMVGELDLVFLGVKAAWPHLVARGAGSIVNMASANSYVSLPGAGATAHCATKGGVLAMTRQLAAEGAPHNIRANCISPALIVTEHTKERLDNEPGFTEMVMRSFLLKRLGRPEDIGYACVYLASDESGWVTGTDIRVDGGATAF